MTIEHRVIRVHDDILADLIDQANDWAKSVKEKIDRASYGYDGGEESYNEDCAELSIYHAIAHALRELQEIRASGASTPPPGPRHPGGGCLLNTQGGCDER